MRLKIYGRELLQTRVIWTRFAGKKWQIQADFETSGFEIGRSLSGRIWDSGFVLKWLPEPGYIKKTDWTRFRQMIKSLRFYSDLCSRLVHFYHNLLFQQAMISAKEQVAISVEENPRFPKKKKCYGLQRRIADCRLKNFQTKFQTKNLRKNLSWNLKVFRKQGSRNNFEN